MQLWSYQHPAVLETLQRGEPYVCPWDRAGNERWQRAYRWMSGQMAGRGIDPGEQAPVWAWHSVNRIGGPPDDQCARALMSDNQLKQGVVLLELQVPDHQALLSCYGVWNRILDGFLDGEAPGAQDAADCFARQPVRRRGRPRLDFQSIQACLPLIEPAWLLDWVVLDTERLLSRFAY